MQFPIKTPVSVRKVALGLTVLEMLIVIAALAVIVLKEPVSRRRVAGLLAGMAGVALVTFLGEAG